MFRQLLQNITGSNTDNAFEITPSTAVGGYTFSTPAITVLETGNVGIGTTSPDSKLDVEADEDTWIARIYNTGSDANAQGLLVRSDATAAHDAPVMGVYADGGYKMLVRSTGNVGIGAVNPDEIFHIQGSSAAPSPVVKIQSHDTANATSSVLLMSRIADNTNKNLYMQATLGNLAITGDSGYGKVGIGTSIPHTNLDIVSAGATRMLIHSDYDTAGGEARGTGNLHFAVNGDNDDVSATTAHSRMMIQSDGKVGIGTDTPGRLLDLRTNTTSVDPLLLIRQLGTGDAAMSFQTTTDPFGFTIGVDGSDADKFKIGTGATSVSAATKFTIDNTGNVGIGTTTPQSKLDVNLGNNETASIGGTISVGTYAGLRFGYSEAGNTNYRHSAIVFERDDAAFGDARGNIHILNSPSGSASADLGDARLTILPSGNIGIGTTSPDGKLEVTVTEGDPGLLVSSTSQDNIVNKTQTIQCMNQLSGSNVWHDVAFVDHSCTLSVIGKSIQSNDPAFGGASTTATVSVQYGVGSVTHHHQQWVALNGGDVTGNIDYQYLNSGASSGSYRLQVRMAYSGGTQRIYTSITGISFSYMFEDN
jgi:hypothetical protein